MVKMPLGCAVVFLIFLLFLAIFAGELFDETIWLVIGLNLLFIIIALVKAKKDE